MAVTVAQSRRQAEGKALDLPLIGVAPSSQATVNLLDGAWLLTLIGDAIDACMSRKEAAFLMRLDQAQLTRNLSGDGHLSVLRLSFLGERFFLALLDRLRTHFHLDDDTQRLDRALEGLSSSVKVIAEIARKNLR